MTRPKAGRPLPLLHAVAAVVALAAVPTFAHPAHAQGPADTDRGSAGELFRAAEAALARGDHEAAARAFEQAHRRVPSGRALYNAARAWDASGKTAAAANAYSDALAEPDLAGPHRSHAERRLADLTRMLGVIEVRQAGTLVTVPGAEARPAPTTVHLPPGRHAVALTRPGGPRVVVTVEVTAGERQVVSVPATPAAPVTEVAAVAPPPAPLAASLPTGSGGRTWRIVGWTGLVLASAATAAAAVFGLQTMEAIDELESGGNTDRRQRDRVVRLRNRTNAAWAGAALGAGVGVLGFALGGTF